MDSGRRRRPLHTRIFIGLAVGAVAGIVCQMTLGAGHEGLNWFVKNLADPVGKIFLNMIFMIVVPLLFSALTIGVADLGGAHKVGRVGVIALVMTLLLSSIAVALGIVSVNLVRPGDGISVEQRQLLYERFADPTKAESGISKAKEAKTAAETIVEIVPRNPLSSAMTALEGGLLAFMFFALVFGLALAAVEPEKALPVKAFFEGVFAVSLKVIDFAMKLAPIGVAALAFTVAAVLGVDALAALGKYAVLVLVVLAIHLVVVYSLVLKLIARTSPLEFFRRIKAVMIFSYWCMSVSR